MVLEGSLPTKRPIPIPRSFNRANTDPASNGSTKSKQISNNSGGAGEGKRKAEETPVSIAIGNDIQETNSPLTNLGPISGGTAIVAQIGTFATIEAAKPAENVIGGTEATLISESPNASLPLASTSIHAKAASTTNDVSLDSKATFINSEGGNGGDTTSTVVSSARGNDIRATISPPANLGLIGGGTVANNGMHNSANPEAVKTGVNGLDGSEPTLINEEPNGPVPLPRTCNPAQSDPTANGSTKSKETLNTSGGGKG
uniref:Uncharacterized protein n=1 Tax=Panagrolaimus sp. ES5 TaxID=591445 RepID=A0AC34GBN7_9BILA